MKKIKISLSYISIWIILGATMLANFSHHKWQDGNIIEFDVKSYYSYLPATFIYKDISLKFLDNNSRINNEMWPVTLDNGNRLIVTSYGLSVLYSPFFFLAHGYAKLSNKYEADGYTMPYQLAINFSAVFYLILGLFFLRKLLLKYFKEWIVAFTLIAVTVGTNLAFFASYAAAMPHTYNFALITIFLWLVIKWYESPSRLMSIGIGALLGFIALIRPTNILVFFILLLWNVYSGKDLKNRLLLYIRRFDYVLIMLAFFILIWMPQFFYWKQVSGHWIFYSYSAKNASFFWMNPQIFDILFSVKKGWFVYTPIMLIAVIGIFFLRYKLKGAFWPILVFLVFNIYTQASWWCWWFGGGFSIRTFIDSYGIMALPLAMIIDNTSQRKIIRYVMPAIIIVLTWYNTFQINQYNHNAIHFWWNSKECYRENFLRVHPTNASWDMVRIPDYYLARKGIYEAISPVEKRRRDLWRSYRDNYQNKLKQNQQVTDSLKLYVQGTERTLENAFLELASKNVKPILEEHNADIREKVSTDKVWGAFVKKEAEKNEIPYDSALSIETTRIINSIYLE